MRKLSSERGLDLIRQGAQQYMAMGFEDSAGNPRCPFNAIKQPVETKLWLKGYCEARFKWMKPILERKRFSDKKFGKPYQKPRTARGREGSPA